MPTTNKEPKRQRKPFKLFRMSPATHKKLRVLAALKEITLEEAHDLYAEPAFVKAIEAETAKSANR